MKSDLKFIFRNEGNNTFILLLSWVCVVLTSSNLASEVGMLETENIFMNCVNDRRLGNGNWEADVK